MERICTKCLQNLPLIEFYFRKRGPRAGKYYEKCKDCMKKRGRTYYQQHQEHFRALTRKRNRIQRQISREFLTKIKNRPCTDCHKRYPYYVMDLDHRNKMTKLISVGSMLGKNYSIESIKKEAEKM